MSLCISQLDYAEMHLLDRPYQNKYLYIRRFATRIFRRFYNPARVIRSWSGHDTISLIPESDRSPKDKSGSSESTCTTSLLRIAKPDHDIPLLFLSPVIFYLRLYGNREMLLSIH